MPHVVVKLYSGRSEPQKARLAEAITRTVIDTLGYGEEAVSVSIEDVEPMDWPEKGLQARYSGEAGAALQKARIQPLQIVWGHSTRTTGWLCSAGARFVIGHALVVDGGFTAH